MTKEIKELPTQDNDLFSIEYNKELDCYDFVLKKPNYDTTTDLAGLISWIHQLGVNCPQFKLRVGALVEKKSTIIQ